MDLTNINVVILCAGRGTRLGNSFSGEPKSLIPIGKTNLLQKHLDNLKTINMSRIYILTGYRNELFDKYNLQTIYNSDWEKTNMAYTLSLANSVMKNNKTLVLYGDIAFSKNDLEALLKCKSDINILYDPNWKEYWSKRMDQPINDLETFKFDTLNFLTEIGKKVVNVEEIQGQYIGASFFTKEGWKIFYDVWTKLDSRNEISMTEVLNLILKEDKVKIYAQKLQDFWIEIDSIRDVAVAQKLISKID